jgi:hypothetical protein
MGRGAAALWSRPALDLMGRGVRGGDGEERPGVRGDEGASKSKDSRRRFTISASEGTATAAETGLASFRTGTGRGRPEEETAVAWLELAEAPGAPLWLEGPTAARLGPAEA